MIGCILAGHRDGEGYSSFREELMPSQLGWTTQAVARAQCQM